MIGIVMHTEDDTRYFFPATNEEDGISLIVGFSRAKKMKSVKIINSETYESNEAAELAYIKSLEESIQRLQQERLKILSEIAMRENADWNLQNRIMDAIHGMKKEESR